MCPIAEFISDSATNKGHITYFFIAHAGKGLISTSGRNSDATIMFPTQISYKIQKFWRYVNIKAYIAFFIFAWIFKTYGSKMDIFRGK